MKKQIAIVCTFVFLLACFFTSTAKIVSADEKERLDIQVEAGLNGKAKQQKGFPVNLTIKNNGEDFSGELVVLVPRDHQSIANVVLPIDIAANTTKHLSFTVPGTVGMDIFTQGPNPPKIQQFRLYEGNRETGNEVPIDSSLQIKPSFVADNRLVIGVLTDQPDRLNYLKLTSFFGNPPEILFLEENDLPAKAEGLEALDLLVINNYSVAKLPEKTKLAIKEWISEGGKLAIGSEPGLQQKYGELADLLPFSVKGKEVVNTVETFQKLSNETFSVKNFELFTGTVVENASVVYEEKGYPLVIQKQFGSGDITQFTYNLGHPSFASWAGIDQFWKTTLPNMNVRDPKMGYFPEHISEEIASISRQFPTLTNFNVKTLMFLFLGYLVLIVPVLYFLLKKFDRREWAWITIPSIAIITSIGLYAIGAKDRLGAIKTNAVSIISVNGEGISSGAGSISMLSKGSGTYSMDVNNELNPFPVNNDYYRNQSPSDFPVVESDNDSTKVTFRDVEFWSPRSVAIDIPNKSIGHFATDFTLTGNKISGEITNEFPYNFEEIYIVGGRTYKELGKLEAGETKEIEISVSNINLYQAPTQDVAYQLFGNQSPNRQNLERELKSRLLSLSIRNQMFSLSNSPILVGITKDSLFQVKVNSSETVQDNLNLITEPVTFHLPENGESISLSTEIRVPKLSVVQGSLRFNGLTRGEPFFDGTNGTYKLQYGIPKPFVDHSFQVNKLDIIFQERRGNISYSILNVKTGDYEPITSDRATLDKNVQETYVKDNRIQIKVDTAGMDGQIFVPAITIKGVTNP